MTSDAGTLPRLQAQRLALVAGAPGLRRAQAPARAAVAQCGALIIGGAHGSLAVARSLGRQGIPVAFLSDDHVIPQYSRYVRRAVRWTGPDRPEALAFVLDLARRHGLEDWVVICGGDAEARFVAQNHDQLGRLFRLTTPPWETLRWAFDKRLTYQRAAELGVDCPWSFYPGDRQDILNLDCRFPVILKPTVHEVANAFTMAKAWRADDRSELLARYDQAAALVGADAIVLQELIGGRGSAQLSYAGVWDRGVPVASLVATRARQYPIDFGYTSTFVQTLEQAPIEEAACRFLRSLDYSGLVEVEFKHDARDGRAKLLDVNARVWAWNGIGAIAGVDFAHILWRLAAGESVEPLRAPPGVAWINWSRDIMAAAQEMQRGALSPAGYVASLRRPRVTAACAVDDVAPGIVDLPLIAWRALTRRLPAAARRACGFSRPRPNGAAGRSAASRATRIARG